MEWIKKNKVMVSVVGVGLIIVAVIIAVMLLMPKADRGGDEFDDLQGDMPENLIFGQGSGELTDGELVDYDSYELLWGDCDNVVVESPEYDMALTRLVNTVDDDSIYQDYSVLTKGYAYVVSEWSVTIKADGIEDIPYGVCDSTVFKTTVDGDRFACYLKVDDEWVYVDPSKGHGFENGKTYTAVGIWKMKKSDTVPYETMLENFSFSLIDARHGRTSVFDVVDSPEVAAEKEAAQAEYDLVASYYDRAYTCVPVTWFTSQRDESVAMTRIACYLAEQDGVELPFRWDDPEYYASMYSDMESYDFSKYEDFSLENNPEGMYDAETGEPTEKLKEMFKEANGIDYDEFMQQQYDEYLSALENGTYEGP